MGATTYSRSRMPVRRYPIGGRVIRWHPTVTNYSEVIRGIFMDHPTWTNKQVWNEMVRTFDKPVTLALIQQQRKKLGL